MRKDIFALFLIIGDVCTVFHYKYDVSCWYSVDFFTKLRKVIAFPVSQFFMIHKSCIVRLYSVLIFTYIVK